MKRVIPLLCLTLFLPAVAGESREHHPAWSDVEHWSRVFDDPARDEWQRPLTLLTLLGIDQGEVVADIGTGTGYFIRPLSIAVGPEGKVYAVDIEQAMLDHVMAREEIVRERVIPVLAAPDDPRLPAGAIDLAVIVNTWHHIDNRSKYLRRLQRVLSPEGRVAIVDFREGELPVGPPPGEKLSRETVLAEFAKARWQFVSESVALPYQYFLVFYPPATKDARRFVSR